MAHTSGKNDAHDLRCSRHYVCNPIETAICEHSCICLCINPGHGCSTIVDELVLDLRQRLWTVCVVSCNRVSGRNCSGFIRRSVKSLVGSVTNGSRGKVAIIANLPRLNKTDMARVASSINACHQHKIHVVVCIGFANRDLLSAFPSSGVFFADELCVQPREVPAWVDWGRHLIHDRCGSDTAGARDSSCSNETCNLLVQHSHGLPRLVASLVRDVDSKDVVAPSSLYGGRISHISLLKLLRDSATPAMIPGFVEASDAVACMAITGSDLFEQTVSAVMEVLGRGTYGDVARVMGTDASREVLDVLFEFDRFFAIDVKARSFECAGICDALVFSGCVNCLNRLSTVQPALLNRALSLLVERGSYARAAVVACVLNPCERSARKVLRHACAFLCAGQLGTVQWALGQAGQAYGMKRLAHDAQIGVALLTNETETDGFAGLDERLAGVLATKDASQGDATAHDEEEGYGLAELAMLRWSLSGRWDARGLAPLLSTGCPTASIELVARHNRAWQSLMQGHLLEGYSQLREVTCPRNADILAKAVFEADIQFFAMLAGDEATPVVCELAALPEGSVIRDWVETLVLLRNVLSGSAPDTIAWNALETRWSRTSDALPMALIETGNALLAWKAGALANASIWLDHASEHCEGARLEAVQDAVGILRAVVERQSGSHGYARHLDGMATMDGRSLAEVLRSAFARRTTRVVVPYPRQLGWLVWHLAQGSDSLATAVRRALPEGWSGAMKAWAARQGSVDLEYTDATAPERNAPDESAGPSPATPPTLLEVSVLGRFEVRLDGMVLPPDVWPRKSSKTLLEMLAAKRGHVLRRMDFLAAVWPDVGYADGRSRIYSAVAALREVVGQHAHGARFVLGGDGTIMLNPACVVCDVDQFEALVREIHRGHVDDAEALERCHRICDLYQGDLVVPVNDYSGMMSRRAQELRDEFVDVLVEGAGCAMRQSDAAEAVRLSRLALHEMPLREDAMGVLMRALAQLGRSAEAWQAYQNFSARLVDATGLPPTTEMRNLARDLRHDVGQTSSRQEEIGEA